MKCCSEEAGSIPETEDETSFNVIPQLEDIGVEQSLAMVAETVAAGDGITEGLH